MAVRDEQPKLLKGWKEWLIWKDLKSKVFVLAEDGKRGEGEMVGSRIIGYRDFIVENTKKGDYSSWHRGVYGNNE